MKPSRLGIVGVGSIGQQLLAHFAIGDVSDRVVVAALCDPAPGRARAAAAKFGVPQHFASYSSMLERADVEMVTLCSPIRLHAAQGLQALRSGKHLHSNKTLATTASECDQLIAEANRRRLRIVASPGQMLRPQNVMIRQLVRDGVLGDLAWVLSGALFGKYHEGERVRLGDDVLSQVDPGWYFRRPGGGPMYDMAVYGLHSLTGVLGAARRVTALSGRVQRTRQWAGRQLRCTADDNTFLLLECQGVHCMVYGSIAAPPLSLHYPTYFGTRGMIAMASLNGKRLQYPHCEIDKDGTGVGVTEHVRNSPHAGLGEAHVFEDVMQLVRWVREDVPSVATAEHARHVVEIIEAGFLAARSGKTQTLRTGLDQLPDPAPTRSAGPERIRPK